MIRKLRVALQLWLLYFCCSSMTVTGDFVISAPNIPVDRVAFQGVGSVSATEIILSLAQNNTASIAFWKDAQNVLDGFKAAVLYTSSECDTQLGYSGGDGFTFFFTTSNSTTGYLTYGGTFGLFQKSSIAMVGLDFWQGRIVHKATNATTWLGNSFDADSFPALKTWRCVSNPIYIQLEYSPPTFRITSNTSALDISFTMNLNDYFAPSTQLYVGLSASTGNAYMKQSFSYWEYTASPPIDQVIPILECYEKRQNNYVAHMGYNNPTAAKLNYQIGATNQFAPAPQDRGQPTEFASGRSPFYPLNTFQFAWDGSEVTWTLSSNFVKFDGANTFHLCPTNLTIEIVFGTAAQLMDGQVTAISQSVANFMGISATRVNFKNIKYTPIAKRSATQSNYEGTLELEVSGTTQQTQNEPSAAEAVQTFIEGATTNSTAVTEVLNPPGVENVEFISTNPKPTGTDGTGTLITPTPMIAPIATKSDGTVLQVFNVLQLVMTSFIVASIMMN